MAGFKFQDVRIIEFMLEYSHFLQKKKKTVHILIIYLSKY